MVTVTLPDGSQRQFNDAITLLALAEHIGSGLARAAIAGKVDGILVDVAHVIAKDAKVAIITAKDPEGLDILRHSTAHLLAHAVKQLFPQAQVTIGPVIENGFYYDFSFERGFTPDDITAIEKRMAELAKQDIPVQRREMARDVAIQFFREMGEDYKVQIIQDIPADQVLSFYQQDDFTDLCRGPHVPNTGKLKVFKLMKVAGAYWRGDPNNEVLQRIYGTAWATKKELDDYLHRLEEAEKRDHRKIGKAMDLFHLQEEAPGMVFWHAKGWVIYQILEQYMREKLRKYGYQEVKTPQILARSLWEKSGHWEKFAKEMFITEAENQTFAIKPMSCPAHIQIFNHGLHSYRDLPLLIAEFGSCHRNELSGALHGLMRVRHMVQDDAHVFCTEDQIQAEVVKLIDFVYEVYADFGFDDIIIKLSTRPDERVGSDTIWNKAEKDLAAALDSRNLQWNYSPGEGAFYGPKVEFAMRDCIGRIWQCGTIQLDFVMPQRLNAKYVAEDGSRQVPIMLHRAIMGSFERFLGILIEHYAGHFPVWLAPLQVIVMTITDQHTDYVLELVEKLAKWGIRAKSDLRNEKVSFKIREHSLQHVPYQVVVGDREVQQRTLAVRKQNGEDLGSMQLEPFYALLQQDIAKLGVYPSSSLISGGSSGKGTGFPPSRE